MFHEGLYLINSEYVITWLEIHCFRCQLLKVDINALEILDLDFSSVFSIDVWFVLLQS